MGAKKEMTQKEEDAFLRAALKADPSAWIKSLPEAFNREEIEAQWWAMRDAASESLGECSTTDLADMLGFTTQYTAELVRQEVLVKTGRGRFVLRDSVRNYVSLLKGEKRSKAGGEGATGYDADKARKMKADADLAEILAARAAGKLVVAKHVGDAWQSAISVGMTKLMAVGAKIGALVILERTPKGASEIIEKAIRGACEEIHDIDIQAIADAQEEESKLAEGEKPEAAR